MDTRKKAIIILGICIISYLYFTLNMINDFDYNIDEPVWTYFSKVQERNRLILDTSLAPPLPFWINGLALRITKNNMSPRYMSIITFIITLIITYHLLDILNIKTTKKILFISALLINPYFILYSRTAMTDMYYFSFLWLSLLTLYIFLEKKQKKYITLSGLFFSLTTLTKHISIIFYPLFILILIMLKKKRKISKKETISFIKYSSIGFIFLAIANIIGTLKTGEIYSFGARIITMINIMPFIEIAKSHTQGALILSPAQLISRTIKYIIAITIYTLPFLVILTDYKKKCIRLTPNQKYILYLIAAMFLVSILLKEGYIRQLIAIYPLIYIFAIKNTNTKNIIKPVVIFLIYTSIINIYAFSLFDTKIFGSSKDYLEETDNTRLKMYEYINNHTTKNDIILINTYPDIMNVKESILTLNTAKHPPKNSKYIIYNPKWFTEKESHKIEKELRKYHTLEKTFEYKNTTKYNIYKINQNTWNNNEKVTPIAPTLTLEDIT